MAGQWRFGARSSADEVVRGHDLRGKTVIVTGANTGIGYDTARALAVGGARVILACRNGVAGRQAVQRILAAHPGVQAESALLDLGSLASVHAFCEGFDAAQLDVLICNAGSMSTTYLETADGHERTVGVCHVGHFALLQGLLPRLLAAPAARVVMVSSESHRHPGALQFERFPLDASNYSVMVAYGQAKLCNALMARELQRRYGAQGLTACSLHPGTLVTTDFGRESAIVRLVMKLVSPFTKNCSQGAATSVLAAVHEPAADIAGQYLVDCRPGKAAPAVDDAAMAARLWAMSEDWVAAGASTS
jgi:NAD(P)-dependent dehydrogenase (short-subunit alcohol dehydrogenase family)